MLVFSLSPAQGLESLRGKVTRHRLENGLTFLLLERHTSPTVSFHIYYDVGSVNDLSGQTGMAHLFEHMAFKGTRSIGTTNYQAEVPLMERIDDLMDRIVQEEEKSKPDPDRMAELQTQLKKLQKEHKGYVVDNELGQLYERNGAVGLNASTQMDATEYFLSLPANKIELWAAIESDRMANTVLRQFYLERDVVLEERRLRVDTQPFGKLYENFLVHAFVAHPYGAHAGIGWESDLRRITRQETEAFYRQHYTPDHTVIAIAGDFETASLLPLLERYFSQIPAGRKTVRVHTQEPPQEGERRVYLEYPAQPFAIVGYHRPDINHDDDVVLQVIEDILSRGRTSRLYRSLVEEKKVAVQIFASSTAFLTYGKYPTLFLFAGVPLAPHTGADIERHLYEEIEKLQTEPVQERELQKTLNHLDAAFIRALGSNAGLARTLAHAEVLNNGWESILDLRDRFAAVTLEDIQRVAKQYFQKSNRTVALLVPPAASPAEPVPEPAPADEPPPEAAAVEKGRQLFTKLVETAGGVSRLSEIRNWVTQKNILLYLRDRELKATSKVTILYPDRLRVELNMGMPIVQTVNPEKAWIVLPNGQEREAPPLVAKQLRNQLDRDFLAVLKAGLGADRIIALPAESSQDQTLEVIRLDHADGSSYRISVDAETFQAVRLDYQAYNQLGQLLDTVDDYLEYRTVDGISLPAVIQSSQGGNKVAVQRVESIDFNVEIDPQEFDR